METYIATKPNVEKLQTKVDLFMKSFDESERKAKEAAKAGNTVDDVYIYLQLIFIIQDGWTTVGPSATKRKANTPVEKVAKKKKSGEMLDFYKHRARESKREELANLRLKFQDDKKLIENMKASNKFNPL